MRFAPSIKETMELVDHSGRAGKRVDRSLHLEEENKNETKVTRRYQRYWVDEKRGKNNDQVDRERERPAIKVRCAQPSRTRVFYGGCMSQRFLIPGFNLLFSFYAPLRPTCFFLTRSLVALFSSLSVQDTRLALATASASLTFVRTESRGGLRD